MLIVLVIICVYLLILTARLKARADRQQELIDELRSRLDAGRSRLDTMETTVTLVSPQSLLQRGYSLTLHHGRVVKSIADVAPGATLETLLVDGSVTSRVENIEPSKTK